jgi:cobalt-zinc-cadmium efflux system membrane fusion protein
MKFIYILFLGSIAFSCTNPQKESSSTDATSAIVLTQAQFDESEMEWGRIETKPFSETVSTRGYIDVPPDNRASVSVLYPGYVRKINFLPGQEVRKGEVLFTIQNMAFIDMQEEYLETRDQLEQLEADYKRQKELADENIASQKSFKQAESAFRVMRARHTGIRDQLRLLNISPERIEPGSYTHTIRVLAPISGFITEVSINRGLFINPQQVAMEITNTDHLHIELNVFEQDALKVKVGQEIRFSVNGERNYPGEVYLVGREIKGDERTIQVHGHIEDHKTELVPGMYVTATILTDQRETPAVPESAIIDFDGVSYVLVKSNDQGINLEQIEVRTGQRMDGWVELLNAEALDGREILVKGGFQIATE